MPRTKTGWAWENGWLRKLLRIQHLSTGSNNDRKGGKEIQMEGTVSVKALKLACLKRRRKAPGTRAWWGEERTVQSWGVRGNRSASVGLINQRWGFYSRCYRRLLEGCDMIWLIFLHFKKMPLTTVGRMDCGGSRVAAAVEKWERLQLFGWDNAGPSGRYGREREKWVDLGYFLEGGNANRSYW